MEMKMIESLDPKDSNTQTQIPIIISRQLKKISTLTKSQALYSEVIERNFEIINDLLKKLQIVFSKHEQFQVQFINFNKRLGNIETDVETIHNEHRRNNFHLTTNIEDIKFQINGIDNHVKMIYQDYKKKGLSTFIKSCNNLISQSSISNSDNFNRKTMDETIDKNSEKLNQLEQPGQWGRNLTLVKPKHEKNQQSNKDEDLKEYKQKGSGYNKKYIRQSLNTNFQENEQYYASENSKNVDGSKNEETMQIDKKSKQKSKEMNLNEMRRKSKKDSKYSQITWGVNHGLIFRKENKKNDITKMNAEGSLEMKKIKQKYKTTNINRYKSQIKCLPQYVQVETEDNRSKEDNGQNFMQNPIYFKQNFHQQHRMMMNTHQPRQFDRIQAMIRQVEHKIGDVVEKYNELRERCQNFVTMDRFAEDMYSQFNQMKAIKIFSIQNFANKSETKKALLFINDKIKSFIQLNLFDPSQKNSLSNCQESGKSGASTIISKCLGCNRLANLIEENKKYYAISPEEQKRKPQLKENIGVENKGPSMSICEIKKRTISVFKSSQGKNRKKFSKYEAD